MFVDLEKAFDTAPREMVMGVPEAGVRMVEGIREGNSKSGGGRRSIEGV